MLTIMPTNQESLAVAWATAQNNAAILNGVKDIRALPHKLLYIEQERAMFL